MSPTVVRLAILAYPRRWRRRYGSEVEQLTVLVLKRPYSRAKRMAIILGLVAHGFDERARRTETLRAKTALTSASALAVAMVTLAGGLASDSVFIPNVRLSGAVHLGAGVSLLRDQERSPAAPRLSRITVVVPKGPNPLVSVSAHSAVVVDTKSGQVISVTRAAR